MAGQSTKTVSLIYGASLDGVVATSVSVNDVEVGQLHITEPRSHSDESEEGRLFGGFTPVLTFAFGIGSAIAWESAIILERMRNFKSW